MDMYVAAAPAKAKTIAVTRTAHQGTSGYMGLGALGRTIVASFWSSEFIVQRLDLFYPQDISVNGVLG
jgi:hypothetical protein